MSIEGMIDVIERAAVDKEFRQQLRTNPAAVLQNCDVTRQEAAALQSGDRQALRQFGLPEDYVGRPLALWRGKDEAGFPGNNLNPQRVNRPSTTEAGAAPRRA